MFVILHNKSQIKNRKRVSSYKNSFPAGLGLSKIKKKYKYVTAYVTYANYKFLTNVIDNILAILLKISYDWLIAINI